MTHLTKGNELNFLVRIVIHESVAVGSGVVFTGKSCSCNLYRSEKLKKSPSTIVDAPTLRLPTMPFLAPDDDGLPLPFLPPPDNVGDRPAAAGGATASADGQNARSMRSREFDPVEHDVDSRNDPLEPVRFNQLR